jgi:hypothetical protein
MEAPPKAKGRGQSESRTRETSTGPEEASPDHRSLRGRRRHEHFGHMGDLLGAIQIWNGSRSRASTSSATPPHIEFKESDAVERRQLDPFDRAGPRFVAAAASRPVRSCDNASSGACEVRAATSHPRSGGSGLYVPPRGHGQGRARERWPRGAPVPLARLAG